MSSKQGYWQPAGLTALQLCLMTVIKKRQEGDELGAFLALKDFALVTADSDIITASEAIAKEIQDGYQIRQAQTGITISETFTLRDRNAEWLATQNYNYLKKIMQLCDKAGITVKHPREIGSNRGDSASQLFES
jgi:hypothetical protein